MSNAGQTMQLFGGRSGIALVEDRGLGVVIGGQVRWRFAENGDLISQGGDVLDANGDPLGGGGGGAALTGWETDEDGNFINTGGGEIQATVGKPLIFRGPFRPGGATDEDDGRIFQIYSDNRNSENSPSNYRVFEINDWDGETRIDGLDLVLRGTNSRRLVGRDLGDDATAGDVWWCQIALGTTGVPGNSQMQFWTQGSGTKALRWTMSSTGQLVPEIAHEVTGSRGGNGALASLLTVLAALGLVTDSTS